MNSKVMLILIVVCVFLGVAISRNQSDDTPLSLNKQVELHSLLLEGADPNTITRFEFFAGAHPRQRVVINRAEEQWYVTSYFNSLARSERPNRMIEAVAEFKGEFRAEATDEQLADYDLNNKRAFHIIGYNAETQKTIFHILVGKSLPTGNTFMRLIKDNTVYIVDQNFRKGAFMATDKFDEVPVADPWLDKRIVDLPDAVFTKVSLTMKDKTLVLERNTDAVWVATQGGPGTALKPKAMELFTQSLTTLSALSVVTPEKIDIWGLDDPEYHLIAHRDNGEIIELQVSHPGFAEPAYLKRMDNGNQSLYAIPSTIFFNLFMRGGDLFDLDTYDVEKESITQIAYTTPNESIELTLDGDQWKLTKPVSVALPVQKKVLNIARILASWQPEDYTEATTETGLTPPQYTLSIKTDAGSHTIRLGNDAIHTAGRFAQVDDSDARLVMKLKDIQSIFLSQESLFTEEAPVTGQENINLTFPDISQHKKHGPGDGHNH